MKKDSFVRNSFLLTASNITTGILGFIFSIYLSKLIGPVGIGLYGLVMPIYNLFICLMTAGIIAAISQVSAIYKSKGQYNNISKTIRTVASFNVIWAIAIGIMVFFLAPYISKYGIHDMRTVNAIRITCPAMVFIALSNILKGYFYGVSKIVVPSFIDILEKAMRIITIALLIYMFNGENMGTDDDVNHLRFIKNNYVGRIIFLINKVDKFRVGNDSIKETLKKAYSELKKLGFKNIEIYPISSYAAYLAKMLLYNESLTEDEIDETKRLMRILNRSDYSLNQYYKNRILIENRENLLEGLLVNSGILGLEELLY